MQGGVQFNVVPAELCVGFDIRVTPKEDFNEFEEMLRRWCRDAGPDVTLEYVNKVLYRGLYKQISSVVLLCCTAPFRQMRLFDFCCI